MNLEKLGVEGGEKVQGKMHLSSETEQAIVARLQGSLKGKKFSGKKGTLRKGQERDLEENASWSCRIGANFCGGLWKRGEGESPVVQHSG